MIGTLRHEGGLGEPLEKLDEGIETPVVATVLDHPAAIAHGRAIAAEGLADPLQADAERHMRDIHGDMAGAADGTAPFPDKAPMRVERQQFFGDPQNRVAGMAGIVTCKTGAPHGAWCARRRLREAGSADRGCSGQKRRGVVDAWVPRYLMKV